MNDLGEARALTRDLLRRPLVLALIVAAVLLHGYVTVTISGPMALGAARVLFGHCKCKQAPCTCGPP